MQKMDYDQWKTMSPEDEQAYYDRIFGVEEEEDEPQEDEDDD